MPARLAILTFGILLVATGAGAQQSAGAALREILFNGAFPENTKDRAARSVPRRNDHVSYRDVCWRFHLDLR